MAQSTDMTISPGVSGTGLRTEQNDINAAIGSSHSGATRPSYLPGNGVWVQDTGGTTVTWYFFDGTDDISIGTFNKSSNVFTPSGQLGTFGNFVSGKTAAFTAADADYGGVFACNATSAAFSAAIAASSGLRTGWFAIFQKTDATANVVTIDPNASETINGATTLQLTGQFDAAIIIKSTTGAFVAVLLPNTANFARLASPALTGTPTAPTAAPGDNSTQIATTAYADNAGIAVGGGYDFWGNTLPAGTLWAYGQAVSRTTYLRLFTAIGTAHGAGDGSTTFNLPDKRGRSSIGRDDMGGSAANRVTTGGSGVAGNTLGASGGTETEIAPLPAHTHTGSTDSQGAHTHTASAVSNDNAGASGMTSNGLSGPRTGTITTSSAGAHTHTVTVNSTGSGVGTHNNLPPGIVCNYVIKY